MILIFIIFEYDFCSYHRLLFIIPNVIHIFLQTNKQTCLLLPAVNWICRIQIG